MKALISNMFAVVLAAAVSGSSEAPVDRASIVGSWRALKNLHNGDVTATFRFVDDGSFDAESVIRTDPPPLGDSVIRARGQWTLENREIVLVPIAIEPPGGDMKTIRLTILDVRNGQMKLKDPKTGDLIDLRKAAEPRATDNPDDAQRLREDH